MPMQIGGNPADYAAAAAAFLANQANALPNYATLGDDKLLDIASGTSNVNFVEVMRNAGLINAEDYAFYRDYFAGNTESWISTFYNNPEKNIDRDNFLAQNQNMDDKNRQKLMDLFDLIDRGSSAGGFQIQTGSNYLSGMGAGTAGPGLGISFGGSGRDRPTFIGQQPTGYMTNPTTGEPDPYRPYYTSTDVLVDSTEQPYLYNYNVDSSTGMGQFDPYAVVTPTDPYTEDVTPLSTPYTPPVTTQVDLTGADPVIVTPEVEVEVAGESEEEDTTTTTTTTTPTTTTTTTTTTPTTTTTTPTTTTPTTTTTTPETPDDVYTPPTYSDEEIALYKYRTMTPQAFAASGYSIPTVGGVSAADIGNPSYPEGQGYQGPTTVPSAAVLDGAITPDYAEGQQGDTVGGIGNTTAFGNDINWSAPTTQALSVGDVFSTPAGDYEAVNNGYGQIGLVATGDAIRTGGDIIYNTAAGGHHFGVNPNTGEAWYQGAQGTTAAKAATGFAEGGIIDLSDDMGLESRTGQGLESFLRDRSRATLRRNLAKLAPRPTDPASTMQQGIMPMAR